MLSLAPAFVPGLGGSPLVASPALRSHSAALPSSSGPFGMGCVTAAAVAAGMAALSGTLRAGGPR